MISCHLYSKACLLLFEIYMITVSDNFQNYIAPRSERNMQKNRISYQAPKLWNKILNAGIDPEISEAVFCKSMKQYLKVGLLWIICDLFTEYCVINVLYISIYYDNRCKKSIICKTYSCIRMWNVNEYSKFNAMICIPWLSSKLPFFVRLLLLLILFVYLFIL